jgi:hypothetical protein
MKIVGEVYGGRGGGGGGEEEFQTRSGRRRRPILGLPAAVALLISSICGVKYVCIYVHIYIYIIYLSLHVNTAL